MREKLNLLKKEFVLIASGIVAGISAIFIPPSADYFTYIDFKVIAILFCLMAVISGIREQGFFEIVAERMIKKTNSVRSMSLVLVLLCFFSSMFITNDVALITFVPLTIAVLSFAGKGNLIFVITMQSIAANLGSMLTPVGNPQNLYLFYFFHLKMGDFIRITLPIVLISFAIIIGIIFIAKNSAVDVTYTMETQIGNRKLLNLYAGLFLICLASIFGLIHYLLMLIILCVAVFFTGRSIFRKVDYSLLLTFLFFFIFVGNIRQISFIQNSVVGILHGREMFFAVALSQLISNVPAAVMLSSFTKNYGMLIAGTNIGGLGTLISSLASLIAFRLYLNTQNPKPMKYLSVFTGLNLIILPLLLFFAEFWY